MDPHSRLWTAICDTAKLGGRYHGEETSKTIQVFSEQFGLKKGYVALFPGSGGPLDLALMSNIGPDKPLVYGDPSYEQGFRAADTMGAPKFPVKLTADYKHDVKAMLAAHPSPGAYYIVNPNNPTGTMTPKADILWLIKNKPAGSVVIVDEAYHHFSNDESVIDQVAGDQDVIVLRTFSKIYGMAGIRAGFAIAKPELLAKFATVGHAGRSLASISITSSAGARASLQDKDLVALRRKINTDTRNDTLEFLTKKGYKIVPGSQANMFMVDVQRPGRDFMASMLKENVAIGRSWPCDAQLCPRHRWNPRRDGEVPDGLRQVYGHVPHHHGRVAACAGALRHPDRTVPRLVPARFQNRKPRRTRRGFLCLNESSGENPGLIRCHEEYRSAYRPLRPHCRSGSPRAGGQCAHPGSHPGGL